MKTATWKTVRVFISSTFRDMQAERDHLVRFVFPKLREELLQQRIHLVDVDLRWGVTSEQDALSVCREVVDECRPRFLCMLGGRYGWMPPGKTRSITADEVYYGVLDRDLKSRGFAYFYFRDPSSTAAMIEVTSGEFSEPASSHGAIALDELKTAIDSAGLNPFIYRAQWDDQSHRLIGLKEFGDQVYMDIKQSIEQEFGTTTEEISDEFIEENAAMESFIEERVQRFVLGSRQSVWNELLKHAESTGGNGYLCLTGEAGSGKSALLGKLYQDYREAHSIDLVIPHFVGASPGSTDVRRTLRRLCHELSTGAELTVEIPEDPEKLREAFVEILQKSSSGKHVLILLDAINQFDPTTQLAGWSWLPEDLPPTVRIILSTISLDSDQSLVVSPVLESLRHRRNPPKEIGLEPLTAEDAKAIIREFLHRYRKSMTEDQRTALLAKANAGIPLYLLVALEELRTLGTYEEISDRISQLPPDTRSLFIWIMKRLEDDDGFREASGSKIGRELVSRFASLLGASRHGLSQQELVELLSPGDPEGNVAALLHLLRPYLMRRGELFDFYHGQFRDAVRQVYLESNDKKCKAHTELSEYFHSKDYWGESIEDQRQRAKILPPTPRPVNVRKVEELPWQLLETSKLSGEWDAVEKLFTDLFFLEAKTEAGMVFELAGDFAAAVSALPPILLSYKIIRLLEEAILRKIYFITRHPTALFQSLWNLCWWYDNPKALENFHETKNRLMTEDRLPEKLELQMWRLLKVWRQVKQNRQPGFIWLRSLFPLPDRLGMGMRSVFYSNFGSITSLTYSPDERTIISAATDNRIRIWDIETGLEVRQLVGCTAIFSLDGSTFASYDAENGWIRVYDCTSWQEIVQFPCSTKLNEAAAPCFTFDGKLISFQYDCSTVTVRCIPSGIETCNFAKHKSSVKYLVSSPTESLIASSDEDNIVYVWDANKGEQVAVLKEDGWSLKHLVFSPDGNQLLTMWEKIVQYWFQESGIQGSKTKRGYFPMSRIRLLTPRTGLLSDPVGVNQGQLTRLTHELSESIPPNIPKRIDIPFVSIAVFLGDSRCIAIGFSDGSVHVFDLNSGTHLQQLKSQEPPHLISSAISQHSSVSTNKAVTQLAVAFQKNQLAVGSIDGTVRIWDINLENRIGESVVWDCKITRIEVSGDGKHILTYAEDWPLYSDNKICKVNLWKAETGQLQLNRNCYVKFMGFSSTFGKAFFGANRIEFVDLNTGSIIEVNAGDIYEAKDFDGTYSYGFDVAQILFSPDELMVATVTEKGGIRIFETGTGLEIFQVRIATQESQPPFAFAFSSDGKAFAYSVCVRSNPLNRWSAFVCELWVYELGSNNNPMRVEVCNEPITHLWWNKLGTKLSYRTKSRGWLLDLSSRTRKELSKDNFTMSPSSQSYIMTSNRFEAHLSDELAIYSVKDCHPVAWYPIAMDIIKKDNTSQVWAAAKQNTLYLFKLEGKLFN